MYLRNENACRGHILRKDVSGPNICGYCGRGCNTILERTHKMPQMVTQKNPCTNYIQHCTICGTCIWKYNLALHYQEAHKDLQAPKLCENEVKWMMELIEKK